MAIDRQAGRYGAGAVAKSLYLIHKLKRGREGEREEAEIHRETRTERKEN